MREVRRVIIRRSRLVAVNLLVLGSLCFSACGGSFPAPQSFSPDAARYHSVLSERAEAIKSLSGELGVEIWEGGDRVAIRQLFAARPPQQLRMDTLTPFEQPLATLIYNDQLLALHDIEKGRFSVGGASPELFERLTRVRVSPAEMSALLSGQTPRIQRSGGVVEWDSGKGRALLTLTRGDERQRIFFEESTRTPRLIELYRAGELTARVSLADYTAQEPRLPQRLRVEVPKAEVRVDIKLKDFTLNPDLPEVAFEIKPPPGLTVTEF